MAVEDVRAAIDSQTKQGIWINEDGLIDAGLFGTNLELMCDYIRSVSQDL